MRIVLLLILLLASADAPAYIGPGAGISFLGSLWAVIVGIVLALVAVLAWPVRILWRKLRGKNKLPATPPSTDA